MYTLSRLMLILTVVGCCYCLVAVAMVGGGVALHRHSHRYPRGRYPAAIWSVHRPRNRTMGDASKICSTPEWSVPGVGRSSEGWRIMPRLRC